MIQLFLLVLQLLALGTFIVLTIMLCFASVVQARKRRRVAYLYVAGVIISAAAAFGIWSIDLSAAETTDREDAVDAFHENFGFTPPPSIEEIKLKNVRIYDATAHWMSFTYDPAVFQSILEHDQPLSEAKAGSRHFQDAVRDAYNIEDANRPEWVVSPEGRARRIFWKKDFLDHSFSEYYLWVDTTSNMTHLFVSYFD